MATNKPSDADIFDDDGPSPAGGGSGGGGKGGGGGGSKQNADDAKKAAEAAKKAAKAAEKIKKDLDSEKKKLEKERKNRNNQVLHSLRREKENNKPQKVKIGGEDVYDDLTYELRKRLVDAPKAQLQKLSAAQSAYGQKGLSVADRLALKRIISDTTKELKQIEKDNKQFVKTQQQFQTVQTDAGARLSALQDYMQDNNEKLSHRQLREMKLLERHLIRAIQDAPTDANDHKKNSELVKSLQKIEALQKAMPDKLQSRLDEIEDQTSILITAQREAAAMVAETNAKMKDFGKRMGMKALDFMGVGPFTLGNAVRAGAGVYKGAKAVGRGAAAVGGYINAQRTIRGAKGAQSAPAEMGSLIRPSGASQQSVAPTQISPTPPAIPPAEYDPDDPLTHPRKNKRGAKLTSPTQNADQLSKISDQIEHMEEAVSVRAGLEGKVSDMDARLKDIQQRHDKNAIKPGKPHQPRGKMGARKAKDRFGAVMEARRAAAAASPDAADVQEPISLRNKPFDPDARGAFQVGTMKPISIADATKVPAPNEEKFDPDKVGAFKLKDGKISPTSVADTVKPIKTKQKEDTVVPRQVTAPGPVSQQEEDNRKTSDYQEDSLSEARKLNDILSAHASAQSRFNDRLLGQLRGRSKSASQSGGGGLGSIVSDLASSIGGLGKMLPGLVGMLGKGLAVAGAWEAGQFVGKKIYDNYGEDIGKGVDATVSGVTHMFGGKTNDDKIQEMLNAKPGSAGPRQAAKGKVTDLSKGPDTKPVNLSSTAGAGRGSVNPPMAQPSSDETAPTPSSAASPILDDSSGGAQATPIKLPSASMSGDGGNVHSPAGEQYPIAAGGASSQYSQTPGGDGSGGGRVKDFMGKLFSKSSGVNTEGLHPKMQDTLVRMGNEYFQATGKKLNFNSAFRSMEEQEKLFRTKPPGMAGKPGGSLHNFGLAVDIPSVQANELDKLGLLGKYGFTRPIPNEKWHIQPAGISVAAAKAGIFSADAPTDQGQSRAQVASAQQQAPGVTSANYDVPKTSGSGAQMGSGGASGSSGGTAGGTRVSATSIPTFDNSDGSFLALNTGII